MPFFVKKTELPPVEWHGKKLAVRFSHYTDNDRLALLLHDPEEDEPYATASVNVVEAQVPDGHVLIKNWSENEGVLEALIAAKIIGPPTKQIPVGFVYALLCPLLVEPVFDE